ncbi:MAG: TolC family protein [Spirochaetales bacterium]|nr:TolC family protein [Spirochaetales bacterium]
MKKKLIMSILFLAVYCRLFGTEITLEKYIKLVEKNSKELMNAAKDVEMAGATEKAAKSQAYPLIGAQTGYTRNLTDIEQSYPVAVDPSGSGMLIYKDIDTNYDNEYSFGISLTQNLFNLKVFNAIKASKEYKLMSSDVFDIQHQAVITIAKKVYYQYFLLEQLLKVKINMEKNTYENYLNIKNKFENGLVSQFDLLRAEVDWKMKIPETTQAQKNLDLAGINFCNLAGISSDETLKLACDINDYPEIPLLIPFDEVLSQRPDYKATMRELSLREINEKVARADHYPTVKGNILYASSMMRDTDFEDYNATVAQVGINISLPLFSGGALTAQDNKARIELEQTDIKLKQLKENIYSEINSIYLTLKETHERIELANATIETAQKAYSIAQSSYNNGIATQLDLKDATVSLELAKINHISAVYEYLSAYFDWQKAKGDMAFD